MAWQEESVIILRTLLGDLSATPTYSDARLQQLFVVSASLAVTDFTFDTTYTINISATGISPDPTDVNGARDDSFMGLVSLRSVCLVGRSEMKGAAGQSIDIRDGSSAISLGGIFQGKSIVAKDACQAYEDAKNGIGIKEMESGANARAIVGPYNFRSNRSGYGDGGCNRNRFS